jgi:hypothetical protein
VSDPVQIVAVSVSALLLALVLELVRRRKLTDEHSLIWIVGASALLGLSWWRNVLDVAAGVVGIYYPPALLLLVLTGFVFLVSLYFSVVISRQRQEIERMLEELALLDADIRQLRGSARPVLPAELRPGSDQGQTLRIPIVAPSGSSSTIPPAEMIRYTAGDSGEPAQAGSLPREQHVGRVQPDDQSAA